MERGRERKRRQEKSEEEKRSYQERGVLAHGASYRWLDSPADEGGVYPFAESFRFVIPEGMKFSEFIEGVLHDRRGNARGIEFGGIGVTLFNSFSENFSARTVGVSLHDERRIFAPEQVESEPKNHTVVIGDFFDAHIDAQVLKMLEADTVDFILERIGAGVDLNIQHPIVLARLLARWYRLLRTGGIMCIQVPVSMNPLMPLWIAHVASISHGSIHIDFNRSMYDSSPYGQSALVLRKYEGAPEELPLLPVRSVV